MAEDARLLAIDGLVTGYGKKQVLNGVTIEVQAGEIVALIGHNGAGKSTLLKAAFGLRPIWSGRVIFDGSVLNDTTPRDRLLKQVVYVPQGNRVFADLTVRENLILGGTMLPDRERLDEGIELVFQLFPTLKSRLRWQAGTLSGGEKQMLALANALILRPRLLFLDEPSLGLAPHLASAALYRIQQISRDWGTSILVVEQKVREILKIARRAYVLRNGFITYAGAAETLQDENKLRDVFL